MFALWAILVAMRSPTWGHDALVLVLCILAASARLQLVVLLPAAFAAVVIELALRGGGVRLTVRPDGARALATHRRHGRRPAAGCCGVRRHRGTVPDRSVLGSAAATDAAGAEAGASRRGAHSRARHGSGSHSLRRNPRRRVSLGPQPPSARRIRLRGACRVGDAASRLSRGVHRLPADGRRRPAASPRALSDLCPPALHHRDGCHDGVCAVSADARSGARRRPGRRPSSRRHPLPLDDERHGRCRHLRAQRLRQAGTRRRGQALQSATLIAVTYALCLGLVYALARPNTVLLVAATAGILLFIGVKAQTLLDVGARAATAHTLPATRNWVDAAGPTRGVAVLENARRQRRLDLANAETAFYNLSISRLYYVCSPLLLEQFGEVKVGIDRRGVVREGASSCARRVCSRAPGHRRHRPGGSRRSSRAPRLDQAGAWRPADRSERETRVALSRAEVVELLRAAAASTIAARATP